MYCFSCGKTFSEYELVQKTDTTGEKINCCPHCGDNDMTETETCKICGRDFIEGEIHEGYCLECLWKAIDYQTALQFMEEKDCLHDFIITDWFDGGQVDGTSDSLRRFLWETFLRLKANDLLMCEDRFLEACRNFCLPYYHSGDFGVEGQQFAEWYAKREAKK